MLKGIKNEKKAFQKMDEIRQAMDEGNNDNNEAAKEVLKLMGIDMSQNFGVSVRRPSKEGTNGNPYEIEISFLYDGDVVYLNNYKNHTSGVFFTDKNGEAVNYYSLVKMPKAENALKELEFFNPGTMKALNFLFAFDFCKPYEVREIHGAFTVNAIKKALGIKSTEGKRIACLTTGTRYRRNEPKAVLIDDNESGGFSVDIDTRWQDPIEEFYIKGDFNAARKMADAEALIIMQDKDNLTQKPALGFKSRYGSVYDYKRKNLIGDEFSRYNLIDVSHTHYSGGGSYIGRMEIQTRAHRGEVITLEPSHRYALGEEQQISEIIDKSGYLLQSVRERRQTEAEAIRKQKEKAAADSVDASEKIAVLDAILSAKKAKILEELKAATTAAQFDNISDSLDKWRSGSLGWLADYVETFKHKAKTKSFDNPREIENLYKKIVDAAI